MAKRIVFLSFMGLVYLAFLVISDFVNGDELYQTLWLGPVVLILALIFVQACFDNKQENAGVVKIRKKETGERDIKLELDLTPEELEQESLIYFRIDVKWRKEYMFYNEPVVKSKGHEVFNKNNSKTDERLEAAIETIFIEMAEYESDSDEYLELLDRLQRLYAIRQNENKPRKSISPDTALTVAGNLAGIALIVNYEKLNVVTSKAMNLLLKVK